MAILSMTGFGTSTFDVEGQSYDVQIKSVNHKSFNARLRLPSEFSFLEIEVRKELQKSMMRGAVDLIVSRADASSSQRQVMVDLPAAEHVMDALKELASKLGTREPSLDLAIRVGDFISLESRSADEETLADELRRALSTAVDNLQTMRAREGEALLEDMCGRLNTLSEVVEEVASIAPLVQARYEEKLRQRLAELESKLDTSIDESRIATELVVFSDKCDVTEEVVRARAHLARFKEIIEDDSNEVGKRLDFLAQELGREFNTMGSKGRDVGVAEAVVTAKVELEKIREQVQNVL